MIVNDAGIYYYQKSKKRNKRKFCVIFFVISIALVWVGYFMYYDFLPRSREIVAGVTTSQLLSNITPAPNKRAEGQLKDVVKKALKGTSGRYGIIVLNLGTGEYYFQNESTSFEAASLYKLWIMATVFEQLKSERLNEVDILRQDFDVLRMKFNIATPSGKMRNEEKNEEENIISFTVDDALTQMITISDNNAALLLSERVRLANVALFLEKQGFINSKLGTDNKGPSTTPLEIALFLKRLYEGKIVDGLSSSKMLDLLKWQKLNNKIPKYLPKNVLIAHKTGELDEFNHDVGIVYAPSGDYIIVVLSESDASSRYLAEERIAIISRDIYQYFSSQN